MNTYNPFDEIQKKLIELENKLDQLLKTKQEPQKDNDILFSREETAKIIKVSLPTLNSWTKEGFIPSYKIANRVYYKKDEVMESLKKTETYRYRRN